MDVSGSPLFNDSSAFHQFVLVHMVDQVCGVCDMWGTGSHIRKSPALGLMICCCHQGNQASVPLKTTNSKYSKWSINRGTFNNAENHEMLTVKID